MTMADGRTCSTAQSCTEPLTLVLPNLRERRAFTVFPLARYDVILGKPWLSATNTVINYRTNEVQIGCDRPWQARVNFASPATEQPDVQLNFCPPGRRPSGSTGDYCRLGRRPRGSTGD